MSLRLPWSALSAPARRGLLVHALHWQAVAIGQTFVGVYLFRLSHGYAAPSLNAIGSYLAIPPGYALAAAASRRWGAGASLRLGLLVYALFQGLILWLGDRAVDHSFGLGAFWGVGVGCYWQSWVLLMMDLSEEGRDRDTLLSSNQFMYFLSGLTATPLVGAFLARFGSTQGYPYAFAASLLLFSAAVALSLPLKGRPQHGSSAFLRLLSARKPPGWGRGLASAVLMGAVSVGALFLPLLLAYEAGGGEGHGGAYAALTALAGALASAVVARVGHPERRAGFLFWSGLAVSLFTLPLAFHRSYGAILVYGVGMALYMSTFNVPLFAAQIRIVEASPRFRHRRADAMLIREFALNAGRVLAALAVLWGVKGLASSALTWLALALALTPAANFLLMRPYLGSRLDRPGVAQEQ